MPCVVALCWESIVDKKLGDGECGIYLTPIIEGLSILLFLCYDVPRRLFPFLNHLSVADMILFNCRN
jgi:hypothetical protein